MPTYISYKDLHVNTFVTEGKYVGFALMNIFPHAHAACFFLTFFFWMGCHFWTLIHLDEAQIYSDGWMLQLSLWLNMLNHSRPKFLSSDLSSLVMLLSSTVNLFCLIHVSLKRYHSSPYWPVQWLVAYLRACPPFKSDYLTYIGAIKAANLTSDFISRKKLKHGLFGWVFLCLFHFGILRNCC